MSQKTFKTSFGHEIPIVAKLPAQSAAAARQCFGGNCLVHPRDIGGEGPERV